MKVELTRTLVPDDLGSVEFCALCGEDFEVGVVYPVLLAGSGMDAGTLSDAYALRAGLSGFPPTGVLGSPMGMKRAGAA